MSSGEGPEDGGLPSNERALTEDIQALLDDVPEAEGSADRPAEPGRATEASSPLAGEPSAEPGAGAIDAGGAQTPGGAAAPRGAPRSAPDGEAQPQPPARQRPAPQGEARSRVAERPRMPQAPMPSVAPQEDPAPAGDAPPAPPEAAPDAGDAPPAAPADPTPDWARPHFQALILHVGPLRVAVPLVKLRRVVAWADPEAVQPAVGQPEWMHGLLDHRRQLVQVVDTARLILPEDRLPPPAERRAGRIVLVADGSWGLACQEVGDVLRVRADQVAWRTSAGRRPWLAGTVREHLCALIDTDAFARMLEREGGLDGTLAQPGGPGQNGAAGAWQPSEGDP